MWIDQLIEASGTLCCDDYPVWWDGFYDVIAYGGSSHSDDNTYDKDLETELYNEYRAGAKAAESLLKFYRGMFCLRKAGDA
jgi:hypothetical protein